MTYTTGDLVQIPAEVYLFKLIEGQIAHPLIPTIKTKKPQVGIFMGYKTSEAGKRYVRVMCSDKTWYVEPTNINWVDNHAY